MRSQCIVVGYQDLDKLSKISAMATHMVNYSPTHTQTDDALPCDRGGQHQTRRGMYAAQC